MLETSDGYAALSIYRRIQLIVSLYNDIQQKQSMPMLIIGSTISFSVGLAFLVQASFSTTSPSIMILMLLMCVDGAFFILLSLSTLAGVFKESKLVSQKIISDLLNIADGKERRWTRKFLNSCGVIKMKFGGNNFVEESTPLNCLSHGVQIAVHILLLWRNH